MAGAAGGQPRPPGSGRGPIRAGLATAFRLGTAGRICTSRPERSGGGNGCYAFPSTTGGRPRPDGWRRLRKVSVRIRCERRTIRRRRPGPADRAGEVAVQGGVTLGDSHGSDGRARRGDRMGGPGDFGPYGPAAGVAADTAALGEGTDDDQAPAAVAHGVICDLWPARRTLVRHVDPGHRALAGHLDREPTALPAGGVLDRVRPELHRHGDEVVAGGTVRQQGGQPAPELPQFALLTAEEPLPSARTVRTWCFAGLCIMMRGAAYVNHSSPLTARPAWTGGRANRAFRQFVFIYVSSMDTHTTCLQVLPAHLRKNLHLRSGFVWHMPYDQNRPLTLIHLPGKVVQMRERVPVLADGCPDASVSCNCVAANMPGIPWS